MPQKNILIATDDAGESFEILYACHRFRESGHKVTIASVEPKRLNAVIHDFAPGWNTYIEKPGYLIESDIAFKDVDVGEYDALMLPGGRAPEFLRHDDDLIRVVKEFRAQDKWLFAICHGLQILIAAGIGKDLKLTCYENVRFELQSVGGTWVPEQCACDGKIVTGQTWQSHPEFYREVFARLET